MLLFAAKTMKNSADKMPPTSSPGSEAKCNVGKPVIGTSWPVSRLSPANGAQVSNLKSPELKGLRRPPLTKYTRRRSPCWIDRVTGNGRL